MNPNLNANTPSPIGAADGGSYDLATGVITIRLANSKAEDVQPGQGLASINARTYLIHPVGGPRSQNIASDITGESSYTVYGNGNCFVDTPPVARLTAAPTSGNAPLGVNFDASGSSDADAGDAVTAYTFNFGDGSQPVTQANPLISHVYSSASGSSGFFATLTVADGHSVQSLNVASVNIDVGTPVNAVPSGKAPARFHIAPTVNPSHGQTFFTLNLDHEGSVNVKMFGADGRRVADLISAWMPAGEYTLHWRGMDESGRAVPPGVYMVRASSNGRTTVTRVILVH
jgi:PKD repeat protein